MAARRQPWEDELRGQAPKDNGLGARLCMNDFLIEKELARTAAGSVYRAKHGKTGKTVVLKARRNPEIGKDGSMEHEVSRRGRGG